MKELFIAAIPNLLTLIGVIITVTVAHRNTKDIIEFRLMQIEKKQDKHNNLIERMYQAEQNIELLNEKVKVSNHRIDDLEKGA